MYILFSKYLGTNILVTLICVLGQDNPYVHRPFLAYLHLPTSTCHIHDIRDTCRLHMEEAFALHIEYILPSHHAVFLRMFLFSYLLFIIYNIYFIAPQMSLIYRSDADQNTTIFAPILMYFRLNFMMQFLHSSFVSVIRRKIRLLYSFHFFSVFSVINIQHIFLSN